MLILSLNFIDTIHYIYRGEGLKGLRAPSWISEVNASFHVICRLLYVREGGRVNGRKGNGERGRKGDVMGDG